MDAIEVEAVEEIDAPTGVEAPACVLYGGKGGVGKTTMAAATGLASARDGTSTLVVSTDPAHSLADSYGKPIDADPTRIDADHPLFAVEIDPDEALDGEISGLGALGGLTEDDHPLAELLGGAVLPGADEAVALQQLMAYLQDDRFDRVVVDTAPTGHTVRLLALPEAMDTMMGRVLAMRERLQDVMSGVTGIFGGADAAEAPPGLVELRDQIERLQAVLQDPATTDFRLVVVPETMSVDESGRLLEDLSNAGIPVETVVVNRVMEDLATITEAEDLEGPISPDIEGCAFCRERWAVQRDALGRAQELFQGRSVKRVPLFAAEVRDERMLRAVAACLD